MYIEKGCQFVINSTNKMQEYQSRYNSYRKAKNIYVSYEVASKNNSPEDHIVDLLYKVIEIYPSHI